MDNTAFAPTKEDSQMAEYLASRIVLAKGRVSEFSERLAVDPLEAMEWKAQDTARAAAQVHVYRIVHSNILAGGIAQAKAVAVREALRQARFPLKSTSTMANAVAQEIVSAWSEAVYDLGGTD